MKQLNEEIAERFIEDMVDKVIKRLEAKLDELDISLDFIAAALLGPSNRSPVDIGRGQKFSRSGPARRDDL